MILSIDIGTTGLKIGLFNSKGQNTYSLRKKTPLVKENLNTINIEKIYNTVLSGIKEVMEKNKDINIEIIGVDGQMGGIVGINNAWEAVFNFDPPINNNFKKSLETVLDKNGEIINNISGSIPINGTKMLYWKKQENSIYKRVKKFITLSGFIVGKLTNMRAEEAFIDRTSLYLFGLSDKKGWSKTICDLLSISKNVLPKIKNCTDIVGKLSDDAAKSTNLKSGIPVIAGCGDTAASFLGAGVINEGEAIDIAGTCSIFGICSNTDYVDKNNRTLLRMESPVPNVYYLLGINFGGEMHEWFINNIYKSKYKNTRSFSKLLKHTRKIPPGSENILFLPFLGGSFIPPNKDIRGTWFGLDWNHNLYHLYKSFLESIGYEYLNYYNIYQNINNKSINKVMVIGGGSDNNLWNQIKADILGINYKKLSNKHYECIGTSLVAGLAAGIFTDLEKIITNNREIEKYYTYNKVNNEKYKIIFENYKTLRGKKLDEIYQNINKY